MPTGGGAGPESLPGSPPGSLPASLPGSLSAPGGGPGPDSVPPAAVLPAPPGTTSLVSFRLGGGPAAGPSAEASVSSDGRYVAFTSGAPDLVAGDTNQALDVFVLDRRTKKVTRLGLPGGGPVPPGGSASQPSISANGRIVAFTYRAAPAGTTVTSSMVLAWDRQTGAVEVVSRTPKGGIASPSRQPSVSSDGRYVAYVSENPAIAGVDNNGWPDVFRYDRTTRTSVLVSVGQGGTTPYGTSSDPSISANGNLVAFVSDAGDGIVPENTGVGTQVYVRDIAKATTERISGAPGSGAPGGGPADGPSSGPAISADGRYVAFESDATNLVAGDGNQATDVFRRDRSTGVTVLVSVTPAGVPAGSASGQAAISADGRMVAFASLAADLVGLAGGGIVPAAVSEGRTEVYERDVEAGQTILVSVATTGGPGGVRSLAPSVGGNGRFVAFASSSAVLVPGDLNKASDVFLRDMPPVPKLTPPILELGSRAIGTQSPPGAAILSNTGWGPLTVTGATRTGPAAKEFLVLADGCAKAVLHRAEACTVSVAFKPAVEGVRTATLALADNYTGSPRTLRLRGTASVARIVLDLPVGPPGSVTVATGTGFPPDTALNLRWSVGITPGLGPIVTDARGGFRVQVLVFHNDLVGQRDLVAEPRDGTSFPPVAVSMLVSQATADPPSFSVLHLLGLPLVLVIRG